MEYTFKVRDTRDKGFFMVDDLYLNGYAKVFGPTTSMVYLSLCRHADKDQVAFPSQKLIADELNINERTVRRSLNSLKEAGLVGLERTRNNSGKWINNTYVLLDKKTWKSKGELSTGHPCPMDEPQDIHDTTTGHPCPTKDTHKKDTHIVTKVTSKTQFGNGDINEILEHLKNKLQLPSLDGSEKVNRQYAWSLLRVSKTGLAGVKWLIDIASEDGWWKNHITSTKDLWNNKVKLISSKRGGQNGGSKIVFINPQ